MAKVYCVFFMLFCVVNSQTVNNVNLEEYRGYFVKFATEFAQILEARHWNNIIVPNMSQQIVTTVLGKHYNGTINFTNGYVVSMQSIDILESSMSQKFASSSATQGTVQVSGTIRMLGLTLGFDALAYINDETKHYTGATTFDLIHNSFVILKDLFTDEITTNCTVTVQRDPSAMAYLPPDDNTDALTSEYVVTSANEGVIAWGSEFSSMGQEAALKIPFPTICYNCPVT